MKDLKECLVYDLEIKKAILGKRETPIEGIDYCDGWHDHAGMGISCLCAYDYGENRYRVFCDDNMNEFQELLRVRKIHVTFNGVNFDTKVVRANDLEIPETALQYDILREVWKAHGLDPDCFNFRTHVGYSLDDCCRANGFPVKTGNGALAPVQWQRGMRGTVIDYCQNDVEMTKTFFNAIISGVELISPRTGRAMILPIPELSVA